MSRVLIIDDNPLFSQYVAVLLERNGMASVVADSAAKAQAIVEGGDISFVLTDVLMPDMDGIEVARRIAQRRPGMLVIGMTGAAVADARIYRRALSIYGVRFLLQKPFGAAELLTALERAGVRYPAAENSEAPVVPLDAVAARAAL